MRQDHEEFKKRGAEIVAIGPDGPKAFRRYWEENKLPFPGCADPKHTVASVYGQEVNWLKLGRMPALFVIDQGGLIRHRYYGHSMDDIPKDAELLAELDQLNEEAKGEGLAVRESGNG